MKWVLYNPNIMGWISVRIEIISIERPGPSLINTTTRYVSLQQSEKQEEKKKKMENEEEEGQQNSQQNQHKRNKSSSSSTVIKIPSYQEVIESSQSKSTPPSLFNPSKTFSQAFSFIKSSEFYTPPPQPPPSNTTSSSQSSQALDGTISRYPFGPFQF